MSCKTLLLLDAIDIMSKLTGFQTLELSVEKGAPPSTSSHTALTLLVQFELMTDEDVGPLRCYEPRCAMHQLLGFLVRMQGPDKK